MYDTAFYITSGSILGLLILSAFFSGSETALTAASRGKLSMQADKGSRGAQRALDITEDNERLIGSVLLGNNLVNILATSLATALFTRMFGESGVAMATLIMTFLVLIFAEVLPKTYAITNAETAAAGVSGPISIVITIFSPVVRFVRILVRAILGLFGIQTDPDQNVLAVREEIAGAISLGHSEGIVEKEDRDRILGALDLSDRTVEEIMLHRSQIEMVDVSMPTDEILSYLLNSRHTRLPVYREEPENVVGILHTKHLLRALNAPLKAGQAPADAMKNFNIMQVVREPYFIPETATLDDQMREFLRRRTHFALVVDEYGALQGLITLEDILEEIVGEIMDEFDDGHLPVIEICDDGRFLVDGATTIRDLNRATDWAFSDETANTIAGLVIHDAQLIPTQGQTYAFHGFQFEVFEMDGNRISKLKIRPL